MRVPHTKKLILAIALASLSTPSQAVIDDFDLQGNPLDITVVDALKVVPAALVAGYTAAITGATVANKTFKTLTAPYNFATKYLTDIAHGAKVGSMRVGSKSHWMSTGIEAVSVIPYLGPLKYLSFPVRRGVDILDLFVNEKLPLGQKFTAMALWFVDPLTQLTDTNRLAKVPRIAHRIGQLHTQLARLSSHWHESIGDGERKMSLFNTSILKTWIDGKGEGYEATRIDKWLSSSISLMITALHMTKFRSFAGDSAGIQLATQQIVETMFQYGTQNHRSGNANVDGGKMDMFKSSPKLMRATNRLVYSLLTEIGIVQGVQAGVASGILGDNFLGRYGIDVALLSKDLLMPLAVYRARFGEHMPDMGKYVQTNVVRSVLKIVIARAALEKIMRSMTGPRKVALNVTNEVFVALRACENEGLFDRQIGFVQGHVFEGFDYVFNAILSHIDMVLKSEGVDVNFGYNSRDAKEVMRHSRDLLYNMGGYPSHFHDSLQGTAAMMLHNEQLSKMETPGLFGFDSNMEVTRQLQNSRPQKFESALQEVSDTAKKMALKSLATRGMRFSEQESGSYVDTRVTQEQVRLSERERSKIARSVYRQRDLIKGNHTGLLKGLLKERA